MGVVTVRWAPILQDVAARLSGRAADSWKQDPVGWAYALRDAAGVAEPDVIVSHWDPTLEADALRASGDADDAVDLVLDAPRLATLDALPAALDLTRTLAGLFPSVAVTVTSPPAVAEALDADADEELAEVCADALAGLLGAYADVGAGIAIVPGDPLGPLTRAASHHGLELVTGALAVPASAWAEEWWTSTDDGDVFVTTDGPIPGDVELERVRAARAGLR